MSLPLSMNAPGVTPLPASSRRIRVCYYNTWSVGLEDAMDYVHRVPAIDLRPLVANSRDVELMKKARLDCDWYAENGRCFATLAQPDIHFLPALISGAPGLLDLARLPREKDEERWLIMTGHQPQTLKNSAARVFELLRRTGVRHLFYAFDEASRFMPCFREIAPHLDVLIHDESPMDQSGEALLRPDCRKMHRSWVANLLPFAAPFNEAPEEKILFLGSQLGLTDHRKRQIAALQRHFKDKFVASHDHSIAVADRLRLNRFKVGLCPEGRKFNTPAMSQSHTDRPFWSGCLGMVPVSENSKAGDRLDELAQAELILRYPHADLKTMIETCERALALPNDHRRRIYEHFNREETVGGVVAAVVASVPHTVEWGTDGKLRERA